MDWWSRGVDVDHRRQRWKGKVKVESETESEREQRREEWAPSASNRVSRFRIIKF